MNSSRVESEIWPPSGQEHMAQGRDLFRGFGIRQVTVSSEYSKATLDIFQQLPPPNRSHSLGQDQK